MIKFLCKALFVLPMLVLSLQIGTAQTEVAKIYNTQNIVLALMDVPSSGGIYYKTNANGLVLNQVSPTTYKLTGKIQNLNNPAQRWAVDFTLSNKQLGDSWIQWGGMLQSDINGCNPQNPADIAMFEILSGVSTLTGEGAFLGKTLTLYNIDYGGGPKLNQAQFGDKAGVINCGDGAALWFAFQGDYNGVADFYASADVDPSLVNKPDPCTFVNTPNITLSMFGLPGQANEYYLPGAGGIKISPITSTRMEVEGEIVNQLNPNQRFMVRYYLTNPMTHDDFIASGESVMSNPGGCTTGNTDTWTIWEIESGTSMIHGMGANAGINLTVYEMPLGGGNVKKNFAQIGDGAAVINCGPGIAMWYAFTGTHTGTSDFFSTIECPNNNNFVNRCEVNTAQFFEAMLSIRNPNINNRYMPAASGVRYITYPDGSADLKGNLVNISDPSDTWSIYVPMANPQSFDMWAGNTSTACPSADFTNWMIYTLGTGSLVGTGVNVGKTINVTALPTYGFQVGEGASGKCGNGLGVRLEFTGAINARGSLRATVTPGSCNFVPCGNAGGPSCTASQSNNLQQNEEMPFANVMRSKDLFVFPNPIAGEALNFVLVDNDALNAKVIVTDLSGRVAYEGTTDIIAGEQNSIDVSGLPIGSYILSVHSAEQAPVNSIFIKR